MKYIRVHIMEKFLAANTELELRLQDRDPALYISLFSRLIATSKPTVISSVSIIADKIVHEIYIDSGKVSGSDIRRKQQIYSKQIQVGQNTFKLSVATEEAVKEKVTNPKLVRIKQRYRFDLGDWFGDFTVVRSGPLTLSQINPVRTAFFNKFTGLELPRLSADENFEFELEAKKALGMTMADVESILNKLFPANDNDLVRIAQLLGNKRKTLTLKNILPNAIELSKSTFIHDLWPRIKEFAVVDKADGERMLLYIRDGKARLITADKAIEMAATKLRESIFECEVVDGKAYIYDIMMFDGEVLIGRPFAERWRRKAELNIPDVHFKEYTFLADADYAKAIKSTLDRKLYDMDGIIFSCTVCSYSEMLHYKWKPIEKMSIDLLCKRAPPKRGSGQRDIKSRAFEERVHAGEPKTANEYFLFAAISHHERKMMNIRPIREYHEMFSKQEAALMPIQFCPSSRPELYKYIHDGPQDLHDQIVEFGYKECFNVIGDVVPCLRFMRIREDRQDDYRKGYFGNYFRIAEMIWNNFDDPLDLGMLLAPESIVSDLYFRQDSAAYATMRRYNNMVKRTIISKCAAGAEWVLDMACGKGQDLLKYRDAGVKNVIMVDSVADNLSQVISRKYDMVKKQGDPFGIFTVRRDLSKEAVDTFRLIMNSGIKFSSPDFIACNLAIHYLMSSREQIENTVEMFSMFMTPGKCLMITALNGKDIHDLLKKGNYISPSKKFVINKLYSDDKFTGIGQRIAIKLPFSEELMEEPLVNYRLLAQLFKKHKIEQVRCSRFTEILPPDNLSDEEKLYAGLHYCVMFKKKDT